MACRSVHGTQKSSHDPLGAPAPSPRPGEGGRGSGEGSPSPGRAGSSAQRAQDPRGDPRPREGSPSPYLHHFYLVCPPPADHGRAAGETRRGQRAGDPREYAENTDQRGRGQLFAK